MVSARAVHPVAWFYVSMCSCQLLLLKDVQVCFSGDGNYAATMSPSNLERLFQAAVVEVLAQHSSLRVLRTVCRVSLPFSFATILNFFQDHRVSVAHPPANQAHVLPVSQKLLFHAKVRSAFVHLLLSPSSVLANLPLASFTRPCRLHAPAFAKLLLTPSAVTCAARLLHLPKFQLMQSTPSFAGSTASAVRASRCI
jgi:hypothetical protein